MFSRDGSDRADRHHMIPSCVGVFAEVFPFKLSSAMYFNMNKRTNELLCYIFLLTCGHYQVNHIYLVI